MKDNMLSNGYSLADKVFKKLEEEILNGALKAGENLTELRISARLGVSRTPVREAIHRLEQDGLVQLTPNKGAVVVGVSEKDLRDIYAIRMKLEGLASRWRRTLRACGIFSNCSSFTPTKGTWSSCGTWTPSFTSGFTKSAAAAPCAGP